MKCSIYDSTVEVEIERDGVRMSVSFEDILEGDAILDYPGVVVGAGGSHVCGDSTYEGYLFYDTNGNSYFPEDFGAELVSDGSTLSI